MGLTEPYFKRLLCFLKMNEFAAKFAIFLNKENKERLFQSYLVTLAGLDIDTTQP